MSNWLYMKYSDNIFDEYCGRSKAISKIQKRRQFRRSEKCWWKFMHIRYIAYNSFLMTLQSRGQLFTVGYIWIGRFRIKKIRRESICIYPNWTDLSRKCSFFWFWWYHADCDTVWNRLAWEYTYIANYRMRDEDMRETAGRGSASSDLWADSWAPLAAAPMIDGSPVSPFLLRRVTPNGRYTKS